MSISFKPDAELKRGAIYSGTKIVVFYGVKSVVEEAPFTCSIQTFKGWFAGKYELDTTANIRLYEAE